VIRDLWRKLCRRLLDRFYRAYVARRISRPSSTRFFGHRLATEPQVFHPGYFLSTRILGRSLRSVELRGKRFLDMGTGSGPIAVLAAAAGAVVTAADINPHAVALARENLRRNNLAGEVLESDVFSALEGRTFDIACFNIPFYEGEATTVYDRAFFAGGNLATVRTFATGCARSLAVDGSVIIVFSEDSGHDRVLALFAEAGFTPAQERTTRKFFETFHVVTFRRAER
jgi:release factor glutamine methyltransferase